MPDQINVTAIMESAIASTPAGQQIGATFLESLTDLLPEAVPVLNRLQPGLAAVTDPADPALSLAVRHVGGWQLHAATPPPKPTPAPENLEVLVKSEQPPEPTVKETWATARTLLGDRATTADVRAIQRLANRGVKATGDWQAQLEREKADAKTPTTPTTPTH